MTGMFADMLYDRYGGREEFLAVQTGRRREDVRWAVEEAGQTVPMPSFAHADQFAASSGGTVTTWPGDPRSHADALGKLYAGVTPDALAWLTTPAAEIGR